MPRPRTPSHTTVVAYGALFVALGGVSYAAVAIPPNAIGERQLKAESVGSAELQKASVGAAELKREAVQARAIKDGTIGEQDLSAQLKQVIAGIGGGQATPGPPGTQGVAGEKGAQGRAGLDGSPDSAAQILEKLKQVQGSGSGLDADKLDGSEAGTFARAISATLSKTESDVTDYQEILSVPGFGVLSGHCQQSTNWNTLWEPSLTTARTFLTNASGAESFPAGSDGQSDGSNPAGSETWQMTDGSGRGMTLTVMATKPAGDQCVFSAVATYDVP